MSITNEHNENEHNNNENKKIDEDSSLFSQETEISDDVGSDNSFVSWDDDEVKLSRSLLRGIYGYGFEKPSPIQKRAIIPMVSGRDIIAQAQSGTGKTGAFTIGTLQLIDHSSKTTQAIIVSPTRELSRQTYDVLTSISSMLKTKIQLLIGGTSTEEDITKLKEDTPHIIVGCPGRIHDMARRKHIDSKTVKVIVLDEADEMLSTGFKEQIYNIFQYLKNDVQIGLFSATMPSDLHVLTEKFMRDPIKILVKQEMLTLEGIAQYYIGVEDDGQKYMTLKDIFAIISLSQCIIYCNSVKRVTDLYEAMLEDNFPVCTIHSGMEREERTKSYQDFKEGKYRVMISSNVTARGIDIQQVSTVINFDIPKCVHTYLHRIGRSGRWGRKGIGINFVTRRDISKIKAIEEHYCTEIKEMPKNFNDGIY